MSRKNRTDKRHGAPDAPCEPTLRALADSLPFPALITDPTGVPQLANGLFRERLGEALEAGWLALIEPSDRAAAEALWLAAGAERAPREGELRVRTPAGGVALCCRVAPLEAAGRLLGWLIALAEPDGGATEAREAAHREIEGRLAEAERRLRETEAGRRAAEDQREDAWAGRREAEGRHAITEGCLREAEARRAATEAGTAQALRRLAEAEERGRQAIEVARAWIVAAPDMLWTARPDGVPDLHSRAMRDATGGGAAEDWLGLVHPEDRVRVLGLWGHAVATGQPFEAEHRLRRAQGEYRPVVTRARAVRDDMGGTLGWIGSCTEQGEVRAHQDALAEARKRLERARSELAQARTEAPAHHAAPAEAPTETGPLLASDAGAWGVVGLAPAAPSAANEGGSPAETQASGSSLDGPNTALDEAELDQLAGRLRSETLRAGLARWRAARGGARLPRYEGWDAEVPGASGQVEAEIGTGGAPVRLRVIRSAPEMPLLRALLPRMEGDSAAWARASALRRPVHGFARVRTAAQGTQSFERLILPFSAQGERADRALLLMVTGGEDQVALAS